MPDDNKPWAPPAYEQALVARAPWWMLPLLAVIAEAVFVLALIFAFRGDDKTLQNLMAFATVTQVAGAFGFFFMSSQASQNKDDTIAASIPVLASSTPLDAITLLAPPIPSPPPAASPAPELKPDQPGAQPAGEMPAGAMRPTGAPR